MANGHALLGPSSAHRWLNCTRAPRLEENEPESTSPYAEEGTAAHELGEAILRGDEEAMEAARASEWYNAEMEKAIGLYTDIVTERLEAERAETPDAILMVEEKLDFSDWVPEGFGTGDAVILADKTVEVIDLKYGKGVPVSAVDNPQLRLYGLGAYANYSILYDIDTVRMTIVQPRLDSVSTDEISVDDLLYWADHEVKPNAHLAWEGAGDFNPGEKTCQWCKVQSTCRARAKKQVEMAKIAFKDHAEEPVPPELLTKDEIAVVLDIAKELAKWAKDVEDYALVQMRDHGEQFPGWKIVEGRSRRKYIDEEQIYERLKEKRYRKKDLFEEKLIGITKMQKLLGKDLELIDDLIEKPPGKPTIARDTDERPPINSAAEAAKIFKEEI